MASATISCIFCRSSVTIRARMRRDRFGRTPPWVSYTEWTASTASRRAPFATCTSTKLEREAGSVGETRPSATRKARKSRTLTGLPVSAS